jgi:hypothetical protein
VSKRGFQPGQSGNPGGRPKGIERQLREEIAAMRHAFVTGRDADGNPVSEEVCGTPALARRLWQIAMQGEDREAIAACKLLYERMYGLPKVTPPEEIDEAEDDESDLEGLTTEELRVLAKVRALSVPQPAAEDELH